MVVSMGLLIVSKMADYDSLLRSQTIKSKHIETLAF